MILIGLGANLPSEKYGPPRLTLEGALGELARHDVRIVQRSRWYRSAPVPASDQPWYINGVAQVRTELSAQQLLDVLLEVERSIGRVRGALNAPRSVDLDLLAYENDVIKGDGAQERPFTVPHPRLQERGFVLLPLRDVSPNWVHPVSQRTLGQLIDALPDGQTTESME